MVRKPAGMLVAFIDFTKIYDKWIERSCEFVCRVWAHERQISKVSTGSV